MNLWSTNPGRRPCEDRYAHGGPAGSKGPRLPPVAFDEPQEGVTPGSRVCTRGFMLAGNDPQGLDGANAV